VAAAEAEHQALEAEEALDAAGLAQ
jgi:hypothetical protein